MFQDIRLRTLIALLVCLAGLYFLIPSVVPNLPDPLKNLFMKRKIQLGLDLQGGMHLIMKWTRRRRWKAPWRGSPTISRRASCQEDQIQKRGADGRHADLPGSRHDRSQIRI